MSLGEGSPNENKLLFENYGIHFSHMGKERADIFQGQTEIPRGFKKREQQQTICVLLKLKNVIRHS